jgi:YD repeat-containing protein
MTPRAALLLAALAALVPPASLAGGPAALAVQAGWYRSDAIGLALEPLPGARPGEPYLLHVEQRGGLEVRTLYAEGKVSRRWELAPGLERVYDAEGSLSEERSYDSAGRLAAERSFTGGKLDETTQYHYGLAGLASVEAYGPDGRLRARESYELGLEGELRRVRRQSSGQTGTEQLALVTAGDRICEERLEGGGRSLVSRYDLEGRVVSQETWRQRELEESLKLTYPPSMSGSSPPGSAPTSMSGSAARLPLSTERVAGGTRTLTLFDAQGREASRQVSRGGKTLEEWSFRYDAAGRRVLAVRVDEHGTEQWRYLYDDAGNLQREELRERGQLAKVVRYAEGGRVEELYRAGLPFLVVTYRGGVKVLEEFLEGGQVVRRRQFSRQFEAQPGGEAGPTGPPEAGESP